MLTLNAQNAVVETMPPSISNMSISGGGLTNACIQTELTTSSMEWQPYTYHMHYPVYVCQDKTKKAIEILKALQADKTIEVKSVTKFIGLVEQIAGLL